LGDHKVNTNALRQKILDLAIHGKLVKQDPADEPASVMLEKLRAEKEAKIAAGEIKRSKNDSYIFKYTGTSGESKTDDNPEGLEHNRHYEKFSDGRVKDIEDEIPFAVPEGWAWCRLGEIGKFISRGKTPVYTKESQYPVLAQKCNQWQGIILDNALFLDPNSLSKWTNDHHLQHEDIVINSTGTGTIGRVGIFDIGILGKYPFIVPDSHISVVRCYKTYICQKYIYNVFRSGYLQNQINEVATGSTNQKELPKKALFEFLLPLPPIAEQKRIVTAIEAIFAQIDILEQNKVDLQTAVKQAKSKILDLAIHGKLVPQDPTDEPASVMLEKLRAEKEAKIAAGEMKRGKNDSYIYRKPTDNCYYQKYADGYEENISDEIPFDVPAGWAWCRLGEICTFKGGGTPDTSNPSYWNGSLNWASVKDIKGDFLYSTTDKITELGLKNSSGYLAKIDDIILITRIVPGKAIITKIETAINQDLKIILPKIEIEKQFLLYFFRQNEDDFVGKSSGTTVKGIKLEYITSKFIPIPPLAEQKRIVAKIEELFAKLDFITTTLTE